ncbi:hypothetical protein SUGI_0983870 [Cryptomeria japonica]|uniref:uncharacterized protein LOC131076714 n=1 Tax=Cryptomeria japonica TaxID=3369 RepID=UPI002414A3FE|nr:uncharacterized protein LOC131076714 [Cryptomeria japonica]GLJ46678.1 hypothetical protein SUGI_0983870 [Cryptomeria japonica]
MRERGKMIMAETWDGFETRCKRHPNQGTGICPLCLKERLNKLFCPDCGEQRRNNGASSCSCSEASTSSSSNKEKKSPADNTGTGSVEVGSVGRISFLIDSDRPEFDSAKPEPAAIVLLRRSKSAAPATTRTKSVTAPAKFDPPTPKAVTAKKSYTIWSFFLFRKKRKAPKDDSKEEDSKEGPRRSCSSEDRIVVERLTKSRSVGVGRRSFSGYGYIWEKGAHNGNVYFTPSRDKELAAEVKGSSLDDSQQQQQQHRRSGKGWAWAFSSPMRAFKQRKPPIHKTDASPSSVIPEMCRG